MTDISLHGPLTVQSQFAAAGDPSRQVEENALPQQQTSCPNLRAACADGSTFIPKGTDLDTLFGNNSGPK